MIVPMFSPGFVMETHKNAITCAGCGASLLVIANVVNGRPDYSYSFACSAEPKGTPIEGKEYQEFMILHEQITYEQVLEQGRQLDELLSRWRYEH